MTTKADYMEGRAQASLERSTITASWGAAGVSHSGSSIACCNRAFEIYYQATNNISTISDTAHRGAMRSNLRNCVTAGWGVGVDDLEEAFEHLADGSGVWSDDSTSTYCGSRRQAFNRNITTAPTSIVNFLDAVDDGMSALSGAVDGFNDSTQTLIRQARANNWQRVGQILGHIKDKGELAEPWLWTAPNVQRHLGRAVSFANVLGNIHAGATVAADSVAAGLDSQTAAALGVMRTAVGFVPVLGGFYGRAIEMIPGLVGWYRGLLQERTRRLDAIARIR